MLLLVVLALLALFGLIAVAFVVLSGQAQRSAKSIERLELVTDPPPKLLQQAAMQVFRGVSANNLASVMGAHSLLEDIYGNGWITGTMASGAVQQCGNQLLEITPNPIAMPPAEIGRRGGCVLTITGPTDSPCYGQSTRIVTVNPGAGTFQVVAFPNGAVPVLDTEFIINGVPFSGTGFGYTSAGTFDNDLALQPNAQANRNPEATSGAANEDYDAADFQNMLLAAQVYNSIAPGDIQTLPSLHRPALVRYWGNLNSNIFSAAELRNIMMRPIGTITSIDPTAPTISDTPDHPNFTGSNPDFNPAWDGVTPDEGQWDVDNDGDGVTDSVWVDLGMPVRATVDGRLYKPLFAILCVDLDGRLNLNAHGSLAQTDPANYSNLLTSAGAAPLFANGGTPTARGQGFGPAEINPWHVIRAGVSDDTEAKTIYQNLLSSTAPYEGRYGPAPSSPRSDSAAMPGRVMANKWFEYAGNQSDAWWGFISDPTAYISDSYGSPPDPFGVGAVGLDSAGRPLYVGMNYGGTTYLGFGCDTVAMPYELNLGSNVARGLPIGVSPTNNPFSPSELERLLRPFDRDASALPARLAALTSLTGMPTDSVLMNSNLRKTFTTESWDLPCPNVATPSSLTPTELSLIGGRVKHVTDLLRAKGVPESEWAKLLPPDLLAGLKMNINRPFGNGRDDNTDGVVDEPGETPETVTLSDVPNVTVRYDGTGSATDSLVARQLEARYLYVLAMLLSDLNAIDAHMPGATPAEKRDNTIRFLAQWAVNAVDFKDRDSIMTPFEYDVNPFDDDSTPADGSTWDVDGVLGGGSTDDNATYRGLVWGCERPELLISETLAFHDRRTEDLANETHDLTDPGDTSTAAGKTTDPAPNNDLSFDQRFQPQGSLFVELYNPWTDQEPRPVELCTATNGGVDLTKTTPPDTSGNRWPVWQLAIVDESEAAKDMDDATNPAVIDRAVYFVGSTSGGDPVSLPTDGNVQFRLDDGHAAALSAIAPGRYALVGPGEPGDTVAGGSPTYLGFKNGENPSNVTAGTRRIELTPAAAAQVSVYNTDNDADGALDNDLVNVVHSPAAVVINYPRRLSISELDSGYANPVNSPPLDIPEDTANSLGNAVLHNVRTDHIKVVHLRRLANPLLPYEADTNPYRTIDTMPVDLTAFNGITGTGPLDPVDPQAGGTTMAGINFYARQRGQNNQTDSNDPTQPNNLWRQEPPTSNPTANSPPPDPVPAVLNFNCDRALHHTLGFLNNPFWPVSITVGYEGDPQSPFPWLTWNNRPYVSPLELMLVSWCHSSKLLEKYDIAPGTPNPYANASEPFPHLMNLFLDDEQLHRILEFLRVPSPFVGTETWANPTTATTPFLPPFNRILTYREPGRINLNTIYSQEVFYGLMNGIGSPNWGTFMQSRRGGTCTTPLDPPAATVPTEFARPFRSFGGWSMTPNVGNLQPAREIDCTLLRPDPNDNMRPLFQYESITDVNNTDRNPYFHYQGLQRLGNLVTTRSNVYAVWITVGYFEVTPASPPDSALWPDGYQLGRELGVDTGEIERHRAFYIFDRTIPVGFQRGQDLNVEKAILINRFIE